MGSSDPHGAILRMCKTLARLSRRRTRRSQKVLPSASQTLAGNLSVPRMLHCRYTVERGEESAQWEGGGGGQGAQDRRGGVQRFGPEYECGHK